MELLKKNKVGASKVVYIHISEGLTCLWQLAPALPCDTSIEFARQMVRCPKQAVLLQANGYRLQDDFLLFW